MLVNKRVTYIILVVSFLSLLFQVIGFSATGWLVVTFSMHNANGNSSKLTGIVSGGNGYPTSTPFPGTVNSSQQDSNKHPPRDNGGVPVTKADFTKRPTDSSGESNDGITIAQPGHDWNQPIDDGGVPIPKQDEEGNRPIDNGGVPIPKPGDEGNGPIDNGGVPIPKPGKEGDKPIDDGGVPIPNPGEDWNEPIDNGGVPIPNPGEEGNEPIDNGGVPIPYPGEDWNEPIDNGGVPIPNPEEEGNEPIDNGGVPIPNPGEEENEPIDNESVPLPKPSGVGNQPIDNGGVLIPKPGEKGKGSIDNSGEDGNRLIANGGKIRRRSVSEDRSQQLRPKSLTVTRPVRPFFAQNGDFINANNSSDPTNHTTQNTSSNVPQSRPHLRPARPTLTKGTSKPKLTPSTEKPERPRPTRPTPARPTLIQGTSKPKPTPSTEKPERPRPARPIPTRPTLTQGTFKPRPTPSTEKPERPRPARPTPARPTLTQVTSKPRPTPSTENPERPRPARPTPARPTLTQATSKPRPTPSTEKPERPRPVRPTPARPTLTQATSKPRPTPSTEKSIRTRKPIKTTVHSASVSTLRQNFPGINSTRDGRRLFTTMLSQDTTSSGPIATRKLTSSKSSLASTEGKPSYSKLEIGLWEARLCSGENSVDVVCGPVPLSTAFMMLQVDIKRSKQVYYAKIGDTATWNDLRVESVFALVAVVVGCISALLSVKPLCLKEPRRLTTIIGVIALSLSGIILFVPIIRVSSIYSVLRENASPGNVNPDAATPWAAVISGFGACFALMTAALLAWHRWMEEKGRWNKFKDDNQVVYTGEVIQGKDSTDSGFSNAIYDSVAG